MTFEASLIFELEITHVHTGVWRKRRRFQAGEYPNLQSGDNANGKQPGD